MKTTTKTSTDKVVKAAAVKNSRRLCVDTALGRLVAYPSTDLEHPGIYIDLERDGSECMAPVAMAEFTGDDGDESGDEMPPSIVCRVWGDAMKEDYTDAVICQNPDEYFKNENN